MPDQASVRRSFSSSTSLTYFRISIYKDYQTCQWWEIHLSSCQKFSN